MLTQSDPQILDAIVNKLKEEGSFCLSGHQNPDADVIGSQLAVASLIQRFGRDKKVDILNSGHPPKTLSYLPGFNKVKGVDRVEGNYDVIITFESSGEDRLGNIVDLKRQARHVINIDHHLHNPNFGTINYVEPMTSSTAELIFKIFEHAKVEMNKEEATCIYTGLVADTGCFRYGNTNIQSHTIAGKLLERGAPVANVSEQIYMNRSKAAMQLLTYALQNRKLLYGDRLCVMRIEEDFYKQIQATSEDTDEIVNAGLLMGSVQVSVLMKEKTNPGVVKVSMRSKGETDINQVARDFGGGGHRNASGCAVNGSLGEAEAALIEKLKVVF